MTARLLKPTTAMPETAVQMDIALPKTAHPGYVRIPISVVTAPDPGSVSSASKIWTHRRQ